MRLQPRPLPLTGAHETYSAIFSAPTRLAPSNQEKTYENEMRGPDQICGPLEVRGPDVLSGPILVSVFFRILSKMSKTSFKKKSKFF